MEIKCGSCLHDGSWRARSDGDSVDLGIVSGEVGFDLELFGAIDDRTTNNAINSN